MQQKEKDEKSLNILLVEDDVSHAQLVMRGFEDHKYPNRIEHLIDGQQALDYLFHKGQFSEKKETERPHVILLDLRMPKIDGLEVLKIVKSTEDLKKIPVVILTTSNAQRDVEQAYELHANSYLIKPVEFDDFKRLLSELGIYWLGLNQHPWKNS